MEGWLVVRLVKCASGCRHNLIIYLNSSKLSYLILSRNTKMSHYNNNQLYLPFITKIGIQKLPGDQLIQGAFEQPHRPSLIVTDYGYGCISIANGYPPPINGLLVLYHKCKLPLLGEVRSISTIGR